LRQNGTAGRTKCLGSTGNAVVIYAGFWLLSYRTKLCPRVFLIEEPKNLPAHILSSRLLVVHDANTGGENNVAELQNTKVSYHGTQLKGSRRND
jgi:hypothetical protein